MVGGAGPAGQGLVLLRVEGAGELATLLTHPSHVQLNQAWMIHLKTSASRCDGSIDAKHTIEILRIEKSRKQPNPVI